MSHLIECACHTYPQCTRSTKESIHLSFFALPHFLCHVFLFSPLLCMKVVTKEKFSCRILSTRLDSASLSCILVFILLLFLVPSCCFLSYYFSSFCRLFPFYSCSFYFLFFLSLPFILLPLVLPLILPLFFFFLCLLKLIIKLQMLFVTKLLL